jgi:hypothetical protein
MKKKYGFMHITKSGAKKEYRKDEHELEEEELETLYQQFAGMWDFQPLKNKNRFMKWLRESLEEKIANQNKTLN